MIFSSANTTRGALFGDHLDNKDVFQFGRVEQRAFEKRIWVEFFCSVIESGVACFSRTVLEDFFRVGGREERRTFLRKL